MDLEWTWTWSGPGPGLGFGPAPFALSVAPPQAARSRRAGLGPEENAVRASTAALLDETARPAQQLNGLLVLDVPGARALLQVLQAGARLAIDLVVDVEVLLEDLEDLLPEAVILGVDLLDVARDEEELDHLADDELDALVAHLEAADVRHLALHLVEPRVIVPAPLERLARRRVHPLLGREVLLHDRGHVHLGVGDPEGLDLDVAVLHEGLDDLSGDRRDDLRVEPHEPRPLEVARKNVLGRHVPCVLATPHEPSWARPLPGPGRGVRRPRA